MGGPNNTISWKTSRLVDASGLRSLWVSEFETAFVWALAIDKHGNIAWILDEQLMHHRHFASELIPRPRREEEITMTRRRELQSTAQQLIVVNLLSDFCM